MSHITGTVQFLNPFVTIGPDSGNPPDAQNLWARAFEWAEPADPTGAKLLVLHFTDAVLPAQNRLEVDLGYGMDVFTAADGPEFWTRPVNPNDFPDGVPIRYITDGAANGRARLDKYGRGERHPGHQDPNALSNSDPFLPTSPYPEPVYDPFWVCDKNAPPKWENVRCVADASDLRRRVARSVGMIVTIHHGHPNNPNEVAFDHVSTCSVTLVGADLVLTAGHCITPGEAAAASVTFDYEVECNGTRLPGYAPVFHKVKKVIAHAWNGFGPDYALLQIDIPPGGLGLPIIEMRADLPSVGEPVFCIHHPNGAVKKLSPKQPAAAAVTSSADAGIGVNLDVSGGSSGSGLFDAAGHVVGVLSSSEACGLGYWPTKRVLEDVATPPGPPASREVVIVFDRSGSMSLPAGTGRTRIEEARDAASLFVQLVRAGGGNRVGLVSFSSTASNPVDFALADVTAANKTALVGPVPFVTGKVGALAPGGNTSIGAGVDRARQELPAAGARSILLLTDGLQNTAPTLQSVEPQLGGITVNAIGFGTEASLDGALLSAVAQAHGGVYTRAGDPLDLKKFFALAFGNIFEDGVLLDPPALLPRGEDASKPLSFQVCGEETVTVVVGWDRADGVLGVRVRTPGGVVLDGASPGVEAVRGLTWAFLRIPLPAGGERDGTWQAEVRRAIPAGAGEFPPPPVELRYFVQVIPRGGPRLLPKPDPRRYYTGDRYNPLVGLLYPDGTYPRGAKVHVTVSRPDAGVGAILSEAKLGPPSTQDGDAVPALQATLMELEAASQGPLVGYDQSTFELFDRREHDNGAFVPDGVFGTPLDDFLTVEGSYTFHFRATYGEGCTGTRELVRSLHVEVGVDPGRTGVRWVATGTAPGGGRTGVLTITPRDRYGNPLGPGRGDRLEIAGAPGTSVTGPVHDHGDGSYGVPATWDGRGAAPAVSIGQPGREPVVVGSGLDAAAAPGERSGCWMWILLLLFLALLWNLLR